MKRLLRELLEAGLAVTFRPNDDEPAVGEGEPGDVRAGVGEVAVELSSEGDVIAAGFGSTPKEALWAAARDAFGELHDAADVGLELASAEDDDEVRNILSNPAYTGLGGFGRVVEDDRWVATMAAAIEEEGAKPVLERMRAALEATFGTVPRSVTGKSWMESGRKAVKRDGAEAFLRTLLRDLRAELGT